MNVLQEPYFTSTYSSLQQQSQHHLNPEPQNPISVKLERPTRDETEPSQASINTFHHLQSSEETNHLNSLIYTGLPCSGINFQKPTTPKTLNPYRVLPSLTPTGSTRDTTKCDFHNRDDLFLTPGTAASTYYQIGGLSPVSSSLMSPRHSATRLVTPVISATRKRQLSVSPLSVDGIDLNALLRISPTGLHHVINSRNSSSAASPLPTGIVDFITVPQPPRIDSVFTTVESSYEAFSRNPSTCITPISSSHHIFPHPPPVERSKKCPSTSVLYKLSDKIGKIDNRANILSPASRVSRAQSIQYVENPSKPENIVQIKSNLNNSKSNATNVGGEWICRWVDCNLKFKVILVIVFRPPSTTPPSFFQYYFLLLLFKNKTSSTMLATSTISKS